MYLKAVARVNFYKEKRSMVCLNLIVITDFNQITRFNMEIILRSLQRKHGSLKPEESKENNKMGNIPQIAVK